MRTVDVILHQILSLLIADHDSNVLPRCGAPVGIVITLLRDFKAPSCSCGVLSCVNWCISLVKILVSSKQAYGINKSIALWTKPFTIQITKQVLIDIYAESMASISPMHTYTFRFPFVFSNLLYTVSQFNNFWVSFLTRECAKRKWTGYWRQWQIHSLTYSLTRSLHHSNVNFFGNSADQRVRLS